LLQKIKAAHPGGVGIDIGVAYQMVDQRQLCPPVIGKAQLGHGSGDHRTDPSLIAHRINESKAVEALRIPCHNLAQLPIRGCEVGVKGSEQNGAVDPRIR
jgi:hypothetical protein